MSDRRDNRPPAREPAKVADPIGEELKFDPSDRAIVDSLRIDGRMSLAEISRRTGLVEATVRRRLQRMQQRRMLTIVPVVDPDSVGLQTSLFIEVKVEKRRANAVTKAIAGLPEVRYVAAVAGPFDLIVEAFVAHREHMGSVVLDAIGAIDGVIRTQTSPVLRVEKFAYEWEVPEIPER